MEPKIAIHHVDNKKPKIARQQRKEINQDAVAVLVQKSSTKPCIYHSECTLSKTLKASFMASWHFPTWCYRIIDTTALQLDDEQLVGLYTVHATRSLI